MIALELASCVFDEAGHVDNHGHHRAEPVAMSVAGGKWSRLVYLPQLAIVVARRDDGYRLIVPVERVWHMIAEPLADDPLADLAQGLA
jgi:hypothetical protein